MADNNDESPIQSPEAKEAGAIDEHVGKCIRIRRQICGISQDELAHKLGLTFQQVQKYEKGKNRVSAGRLYQIAKILGVRTPEGRITIDYFYDGFEEKALQEMIKSFSKLEISFLRDLQGRVHPNKGTKCDIDLTMLPDSHNSLSTCIKLPCNS